MKKISQDKRGFTLVELLIYIGFTVMILTTFTGFVADVVKGAARAGNMRELNQDSRIMISRMTQEIKTARSVTSVEPTQLVLIDSEGKEVKIYLDASQDKLYFDDGSEILSWSNDKVKVTELSFSSSGTLINIGFSLHKAALNGGINEKYKLDGYAVAAPRTQIYQ